MQLQRDISTHISCMSALIVRVHVAYTCKPRCLQLIVSDSDPVSSRHASRWWIFHPPAWRPVSPGHCCWGNYKLSVGACTVVMGTVCGSMKEAGLSKSMDAYRYSPVQWGSDNRGLYIHVHCKITPGFIWDSFIRYAFLIAYLNHGELAYQSTAGHGVFVLCFYSCARTCALLARSSASHHSLNQFRLRCPINPIYILLQLLHRQI